MRYFRQLKQGHDPAPFLYELTGIEGGWSEQTERQDAVTIPQEGLPVALRGMVKSAQGNRARRDVHESRWTTVAQNLPRFQEFLKQIAAEEDAVLGRAKIVCLPAAHQVYPRTDHGDYYRIRNRYHYVLRSSLGSWLKAGDEEVRMQEGELWWFDNKSVHETKNEGADDRIHLVFDLLPRHLETEILRKSRRARKASLEA